jgi:flagellar protein FlaG
MEVSNNLLAVSPNVNRNSSAKGVAHAIQGDSKLPDMSISDGSKSAKELRTDEQTKGDEAELGKLKEELNKELNPLNIYAEFGYDDKSGAMFVSVYEKNSDQLIRKIPSEEVMRMMSKVKELMGSIIDNKA